MLISREPPALTADEAAHSARVADHLHGLLQAAGGWLPFSRFMDAALYAPGLGYYMAGARRFGPDGDFVTAPELSPLFARCLARQLAEILQRLGGGDLVEYVAGSGRLAADLRATLADRGAAPRRYRIVEVSAALRAAQRATLEAAGTAGNVEWLDAPPVPGWQGIVLANEVLDALPVERFRVTGGACSALGVVATDQGFDCEARPADPALAALVAAIAAALPEPWPERFVSELRPMLPARVTTVTAAPSAARCSQSTMACRAGSTTTPRATAARCAGSSAIIASRMCWRVRLAGPDGPWISPRSRRRPGRPDSRWPASRRRRTFSPHSALIRN